MGCEYDGPLSDADRRFNEQIRAGRSLEDRGWVPTNGKLDSRLWACPVEGSAVIVSMIDQHEQWHRALGGTE